ncbi:MAG: hypothetical protein H6740_08150 [Alphaproteobacteria bacterium]|nr:hypothetical protein [Alphaproteobacteria bacterium]
MFVLSLLLAGCFADFYDGGDAPLPQGQPVDRGAGQANLAGLFDRAQVGGVTGGLSLYEGGTFGILGMGSLTCEVRTANGQLDTDIVVDDREQTRVVDGDGHHVLAASGDRLTRFPRGGGGAWAPMVDAVPDLDVRVPGLLDARLTDAGLIALRETPEGCALGWMGLSERADRDWSEAVEHVVPEEACLIQGISVDPVRGDVWLGVGEAMRMGADGVLYTGVAADHVAWDPHAGLLYAGAGRTLAVLDDRGLLHDEYELEHEIVRVAHLGAQGAALVVTAPAEDTLELVVLDPLDGAVLAQRRLRISQLDALAVSPDGSVLGVLSDSVARFLDVVL